MFATLLGRLPRPAGAADDDAAVREVIAAQEAAGLEPLTDGGLRWADGPPPGAAVPAWSFAASSTSLAVKATLLGPYTLARRSGGAAPAPELATAIRDEVLALAESGCPLIEIDEPDAVSIGESESERARFRDAHRLLADGIAATHLSLVLSGGNVDTAGAATIFDAPYRSYAFDLIAGPDNWRLIAVTPGGRGIVCGAMSSALRGDEGPETLVWAAHYAASTQGRSLARVGLANAPGLDRLDWFAARRKISKLGEAARFAAAATPEEIAKTFDPRSIDSRSAALGRFTSRSGRS